MSDDLATLHDDGDDELWLISYADLLTLLIGFFVLIIASVPLRRASFERIAAALSGSQRATPLEELREKVDRMVERSPELRERVVTRDDAEGLGIEFKDALLFDSGQKCVLRALIFLNDLVPCCDFLVETSDVFERIVSRYDFVENT